MFSFFLKQFAFRCLQAADVSRCHSVYGLLSMGHCSLDDTPLKNPKDPFKDLQFYIFKPKISQISANIGKKAVNL